MVNFANITQCFLFLLSDCKPENRYKSAEREGGFLLMTKSLVSLILSSSFHYCVPVCVCGGCTVAGVGHSRAGTISHHHPELLPQRSWSHGGLWHHTPHHLWLCDQLDQWSAAVRGSQRGAHPHWWVRENSEALTVLRTQLQNSMTWSLSLEISLVIHFLFPLSHR